MNPTATTHDLAQVRPTPAGALSLLTEPRLRIMRDTALLQARQTIADELTAELSRRAILAMDRNPPPSWDGCYNVEGT